MNGGTDDGVAIGDMGMPRSMLFSSWILMIVSSISSFPCVPLARVEDSSKLPSISSLTEDLLFLVKASGGSCENEACHFLIFQIFFNFVLFF